MKWRYIPTKELPANMYSSGKVGFISIFSVFILNDSVSGNQFSKVVHDETGKDLLEDVLHLFCVKTEQAKGVLQFTERGFNTPAHGIELFQFGKRELIGVKIGNDRFIRIFRNIEAGDTEVYFIKQGAAATGKELKVSSTGNKKEKRIWG